MICLTILLKKERYYHPTLSPSFTVIRPLSGTVYFTILLVLEAKSDRQSVKDLR